MIQASDHESVGQVSPFIGANVDVLCGNDKCTELTLVFTKYAELNQFTFKDNDVLFQNAKDLKLLCDNVKDFVKE